jgi:hypothetical protein
MINILHHASGAVYLSDSDLLCEREYLIADLLIKGAMVLNMLRLKLGDKLFFQGIKTIWLILN